MMAGYYRWTPSWIQENERESRPYGTVKLFRRFLFARDLHNEKLNMYLVVGLAFVVEVLLWIWRRFNVSEKTTTASATNTGLKTHQMTRLSPDDAGHGWPQYLSIWLIET
mmetsp:Transcript_3357/g.4589  ORF Transcript_3357/g.4589 Transcript_3357/m.4589 type:complete len:110 (-) Transcript_3357:100-429(-)